MNFCTSDFGLPWIWFVGVIYVHPSWTSREYVWSAFLINRLSATSPQWYGPLLQIWRHDSSNWISFLFLLCGPDNEMLPLLWKIFRYPAAYAQIRNIVSKKVFFGSASDMECMGACDNALIWLSDFHMTCCLSSPVTAYIWMSVLGYLANLPNHYHCS